MQELHENELTQEQIVAALSREFTNVFLINPWTKTSKAIKLQNKIGSWLDIKEQEEHPYYSSVENYMKRRVHPEDMARMLEAVKLERVLDELADKDEYTGTYRILDGEDIHYYQFKYIRIDGTDTIIEGYQNIDDMMKEDLKRRELEQRRQQFLKDALRAAERANNAKTTFLNTMSHDIRTPMNAILGFTNLALDSLDDPQKVKDYLEKIEMSGQHLMNLINSVLDMSRIESGNLSLKLSHVNLKDMMLENDTIVRVDANAKKQKLTMDLSHIKTYDVITDRLRLNQVFINVLGNAVKYTPEGGEIHFTAEELPCEKENFAQYEFHIIDNGIGMSEEFQKHVFEPFTREKTATVSGIQGNGLGMAISRSVVELLGGKLAVKSRPGEGTDFVITLTCEKYHQEEEAKSESLDLTEQLEKLKGMHILLVEDNAMNQEIAKAILTKNGFEVEVVGDGTEAVEAMEKAEPGQYDLILMDIQMPVMNGYDATRKIRKMDRKEIAQIPIIALSANAFDEDKKVAYQVGMNGYVTKPIRIPKLLGQIAKARKEQE